MVYDWAVISTGLSKYRLNAFLCIIYLFIHSFIPRLSSFTQVVLILFVFSCNTQKYWLDFTTPSFWTPLKSYYFNFSFSAKATALKTLAMPVLLT